MNIGERFNPYKVFIGSFIPNSLMRYKGISSTAKLCWARLAQYAGEGGECYPSQKVLAMEIGVTEQGILKILKQLIKEKFIIQVRPTGRDKLNHKTSRYYFLWHECFENNVSNGLDLADTEQSYTSDTKQSDTKQSDTIPGDSSDIRPGDSSIVRESVVRKKYIADFLKSACFPLMKDPPKEVVAQERGKPFKENYPETGHNPIIKRTVSFFYEAVAKERGYKPKIDSGDGKAVQRALREMSEEEIRKCIVYNLEHNKEKANTLKACLSTYAINLYRNFKAETEKEEEIWKGLA